ncbi:MAG TPA: hypothetical protein VLD39_15885, partial [Gammaproteobacteria bacterium]|nr:hypothetical protein [Gammaproteobacteria bacterium]
EAVSPVIVKELRQAVRGRFIVAVILLFLAVQLVTMGIALLVNAVSASNIEQAAAGRPVFLTIFGILIGTCIVCIPAYTGIRLAAERSDVNVDLLFITSLEPRSIILGKLGSAMILTALIYSACVPFLAFTYFLRGVDFPSIAVLLAMGFLAVSVMVSIAITLATIPVTRPFKVILGLGMLSMGFPTIPILIALSFQFLQGSGGGLIGSMDFWIGAGVTVAFVVAACSVLLALATAQVTPPAANRARPVRIMLTLFWLVTGAGAGVLVWQIGRLEPVIAWMIFQLCLLTLCMVVAASERRELGPRVTRSIPESLGARILAFPFYSGSLSGLAWTVMMMLATIGVVLGAGKLLGSPSGTDHLEAASWLGDALVYISGYTMAGIALREWGILKKI